MNTLLRCTLGTALLAAATLACADNGEQPGALLERATRLAAQAAQRHALEIRWDGTRVVLCEEDRKRAAQGEMRMRYCAGARPADIAADPPASRAALATRWSDGLTLHCRDGAEGCWSVGATWRGESKVLGLGPTNHVHFWYDGDAASTAALRQLVLQAVTLLVAAPATPPTEWAALLPRDVALAGVPVGRSSDESTPAPTDEHATGR